MKQGVSSRDDWIRTSDLAHPKRALLSKLSYIPRTSKRSAGLEPAFS